MKDKDDKLIWEAFSDDSMPPEPRIPGISYPTPNKSYPHLKRQKGTLKEHMVVILNEIASQNRSVIVQTGSGQHLISTPEEAEMFMHRMNADRGPKQEKYILHAGIMAKKGTLVEVIYWGPSNEKFQIVILEPTEMSETTGSIVNSNQLAIPGRETAEELIDKWIDFSKTRITIGRLRGLR